MRLSRRNKKALLWLRHRIWRRPSHDFGPRRGPVTHLVILDGTMSSLDPGRETNAGRAYQLCREMGADLSIYYEPGLQWTDWRSARDVMIGRGINRQIRRAYGYLASRYRPGDRIFLMGYSRGAYAVRSLAGVIDRMGLLRAQRATERNIRDVYRHYANDFDSDAARAFSRAKCLRDIEIDMIGAWDTVKALGLNMPVLWRFSEGTHAFHNHELSHNVKAGFHALAFDETRVVYSPVMWTSPDGYSGRVEQVWFPGAHGDVGGQLDGFEEARPLANLSLVWMLDRAEHAGLQLPDDWRERFTCDAMAPMRGTFRGMGKWFVTRRARKPLQNPSERLHDSVEARSDLTTRTNRWLGSRKVV
ncbi:MAG: DUF2235 domain-containing protein [Roseobacter sp.]